MNIEDNRKIMEALNLLERVIAEEDKNGAFPSGIVSVFISHPSENDGTTTVSSLNFGCVCNACLGMVADSAKSNFSKFAKKRDKTVALH